MNYFKRFTAKKALVFSVYLLLFALVVFLTAVPVVFDLEHLDVQKWITNSLINSGIMIISIVLGEITGTDKFKEKVGGLYQNSLKKFNDMLMELSESQLIVYFSQFYIWYKAKELKNKKIAFLVQHGFDHQVAIRIVSFIEKGDLEEMLEKNVIKIDPKTKKEVKFRKIHKDEYEVLKEVFSTDFTLDSPKEYTYYLTAFNDNSSASVLEKPRLIEKKERSNKLFNRTFKIVLSLFISVLWGTATISETSGGAKAVAANLIARLTALFGGALSGLLTSIITVKLESEKLEDKYTVLRDMKIHYEKGEFKPKSYDELVEEEIREEREE